MFLRMLTAQAMCHLQDLLEADQPPRESRPSILVFFLGLLLVLLGLLSLAATFFICFLAKIIPPEDGHFTFMLKRDRYYHLLVPLTVPVTIIMISVNWFSMKLFKHNS